VTVESAGKTAVAKEGQARRHRGLDRHAAGATAVIELPDGTGLKLKEQSRFQLSLPEGKERHDLGSAVVRRVFARVAKSARQLLSRYGPRPRCRVRGSEFFTPSADHGKRAATSGCA